ncbi:unnamed protein product [Calypogeia fissa]
MQRDFQVDFRLHSHHRATTAISISGRGLCSAWEFEGGAVPPESSIFSHALDKLRKDSVYLRSRWLTWLQCTPCTSCFSQPSPYFDPMASSTYQSLSCTSTGCTALQQTNPTQGCNSSCPFSQGYGDGSYTEGNFSSETINLKSTTGLNITVADFWFGCSYTSSSPSGSFDSADGVIGLSPQTTSLPSQLGHVFEDKFSYCLVNRSAASVQSSLLVFGKDADLDLRLQYTPVLSNPSAGSVQYYYYVGIEGISVGGVALDYNATAFAIDSTGGGGTIIDSGTTFTYLSPLAFGPLLAVIIAKVPSSYQRIPPISFFDLCYNVSAQGQTHWEHLPEVSFKLANNTNWNLSEDNAWEHFTDQNATCFSIFNQSSLGDFSILGNTQQRDFLVLYDRVESRLGFRKTDCAAASLYGGT